MKLSQLSDDKSLDTERMSDSAYLLSVNGFSINCNYSVVLTIKLQQKGMFGGTSIIENNQEFPIFIRSKPLRGENLADVE